MVAAIELDDQPRLAIEEVGSPDKSEDRVVEVSLHLRARQARLEEQPSQARLHRRFRRSCKPRQRSQARSTMPALRSIRISDEAGLISESPMQRHVDRDERLEWWPLGAQVPQGSVQHRCRARTVRTSRELTSQRRTLNPKQPRNASAGGSAISTGPVGSNSSPRIHAAACPRTRPSAEELASRRPGRPVALVRVPASSKARSLCAATLCR
jgi:hypothetical protein